MKQILLALALSIVPVFCFAQTDDSKSVCSVHLSSFENLLQQARVLAAENGTQAELAKALKAAANAFLNANGGPAASQIPPVVIEGLTLAKKIDPAQVRAAVKWDHRVVVTAAPHAAEFGPLAREAGYLRIFVTTAKGELLAGGKAVDGKAIRGIKVEVVVARGDERFSKIPEDLVFTYNYQPLTSIQERYVYRRQRELYTKLLVMPGAPAGAGEKIISFVWLTNGPRGYVHMPDHRMMGFAELSSERVKADEAVSFIQYSLSTTGRERIVGSVRSGGSRYSR